MRMDLNLYAVNKISIAKFIPAIAWFIVVLVLMCLPGKDIPSIAWTDKVYFDKWVHTGLFGLLTLLLMLPFAFSPIKDKEKIQYYAGIAITVSIWGLLTEFIQKYWIPGRSFDLLDWAADSFGALLSFIVCQKKLFFAIGKSGKFFN